MSTSIQHYALIYPQRFNVKPDAKKDVGKIHNYFKRNPYPKPYTLYEIVQAFCSGQTVMMAMVERELKTHVDVNKVVSLEKYSSEWSNMHTLEFKSTRLLGIDIDDEYSETDLNTVLKHFKGRVAGAYYSFSHGKSNDQGGTQNRYRLLFQFDELITDYEIGKEIPVLLKQEILGLYPSFNPNKIDTMQPKTLFHGSSREPILIDDEAVLSTSEYVEKAKQSILDKQRAMKDRRKSYSTGFKDEANNPVTMPELVEMAEQIGHIPNKTGRYEEWRNCCLAIRNYEFAGHITEQEGLQLFHILSGGESDENTYFGFHPNGELKIGTFIKIAQDNGYKRKHSYSVALQEVQESIETERIKVDTYMSAEVAEDLLNRKQRLLVDSPTGSGKTSSFMKAFKTMQSRKYRYFIFCTPTIALTEQVAREHEVTSVVGGQRNLRQIITDKAIKGERTFIVTFDKAAELIHYLSKDISYGSDKPEFNLVIDEVHKFTEAYNYRFSAIDRLEELSEMATSLIGLTGTPEDVLKDNFEKFVKIDNGNLKAPCGDYRVFTYDTNENGVITSENSDLMLIPVIRGLLQQTRVLLFINNKDRIKKIARMLKKEGITYRTVSSDNKTSPIYKGIVDTGEIEDGVQVVLSTTVLADGISIKNKLNWSCVVACDRDSQIFNPSTIKQISHRFRNEYRYFALYMRTPNPDYAETRRFNIEADYQYRLRTVQNHVHYLNEEFTGELLQDFVPSVVEKHNGIYYRSKDEDAVIEFNPLFVRHQSMRTKERYYSAYRTAFIAEVERSIGHKLTGLFNVNEEIKKNSSDMSGLLADLQQEKEEKQLEADELRRNFAEQFDQSIFGCFVREDEEALRLFKEDVHPDLYTAASRIAKLTDYETCRKLSLAVTNRNEVNKYTNDIKALAEVASFQYVKKRTVTKRIYVELLKLDGKTYVSSDFKELTEERLPKKMKVTKSEVKETLKLFHKFSTRPGGVSSTTIRPLTAELVAKIRHEIDEEKVKFSLLRYVGTKPEQQQKVMIPAIHEAYGITWYEEKETLSINY